MSFFQKKQRLVEHSMFEKIKSPVPLEHLDVTKRYDIYISTRSEERLYENFRFVASRTLEDISPNFTNLSGLLEIEAIDGTRIMLTKFNIHMVCEHGAKPHYKVLRSYKDSGPEMSEGL